MCILLCMSRLCNMFVNGSCFTVSNALLQSIKHVYASFCFSMDFSIIRLEQNCTLFTSIWPESIMVLGDLLKCSISYSIHYDLK